MDSSMQTLKSIMKPRHHSLVSHAAIVLGSLVLSFSVSSAADRYFDTTIDAGLAAGTATWDTGATEAWSDTSAGESDPLLVWAAGDDAFFQTGGNNTVTLSGTVTANSLSQSVDGTATTISGGTLSIGNGGIAAGTSNGILTISSNISLGANQIWTSGISGTDYSTQVTASSVISGAGGLTIAGTTSAPRAVRLNGANDFTGDFTVATGGSAMLGANSIGSTTALTTSPCGLGNVILNHGATLLLFTNYNIATNSAAVPAKKLTINGDIAIGQVTAGGTLVGTGRMTYGGLIDLGSATRTISLGRAVTATNAISTSTPGIAFASSTVGNATIQNGTMRFVLDADPATDTTLSYAGVSFGSQSIWQNDSGVVIGNRVATSFGSGLSFNTANSYPHFTVEAGGYLNLSDGGANARNARIKSLSGAGTVLNCTSGSATATLTIDGGAATGSFEFSGDVKNNDSSFAGGGSGVVGITKLGNTTQILSGINTYNGATSVTGGKLYTTTKSSNGNYSIGNGTTLGVKVDAAGSDLNVTALTLGATTLEIDLASLGNPTTAVINNSGALTVNGTVTVNLSGDPSAMSAGTFTLISSASRSGSGSFVKGSLPPGVDATLTDSGNTVTLTINSITPIYQWTGATNNIWNLTAGNINWLKNGSPSAYADIPATDIILDDSATGSTFIDISAVVSPKSTIIDALSKTYSLSGAGRISGSGGVTKKGASTVTVSTANDYSGNTEISAGTFKLAAANVIPDGTGKGNTSVDGTLDLAGFNETINGLGGAGQITDSAAGSSSLTVGNDNASSTFAGALTGTVALVKTGGGTLTLTGASNHSGGTVINGGTLSLGNGGTSGSLPSAGTLTTNATFTVNRSNTVTQGSDFPGLISGSGGIEKLGVGTLVLNASNNYAGLTSIGAGNLAIEDAGALGTTAAGTTVASGASILLRNGFTVSGETATISGLGAGSRGVIRTDDADAEWGGNLIVVSTGTDTRLGGSVTAGGTLTLSGSISGGDPNAVSDPSAGFNGYPAVVSVRSADASDTVVLSGTSSFNGNFGIFVGQVRLDGGNNRLPTTSRLLMGFPGTTPYFDLNGRNQQLAGLYDYQSGTGALATVTTAHSPFCKVPPPAAIPPGPRTTASPANRLTATSTTTASPTAWNTRWARTPPPPASPPACCPATPSPSPRARMPSPTKMFPGSSKPPPRWPQIPGSTRSHIRLAKTMAPPSPTPSPPAPRRRNSPASRW
jgi:fibronectin-binding autotransporter adhesin